MIQLKNNAQSMLAYPVSGADTTLTVIPEDIGRFPALTVPGDHFYCALADSQGNLEFVRVTGVNTQTAILTVVRGAEGTTARGWNTGDRVQLRMSMATWTDMAGDWWQRVKTTAGDALAPTLVSASSFSLSGDWLGEMQEGRRLKITASDGTQFKGHVASSTLANGTTTVTVGGDPAPTLAGTLVAVDMGFSTEMESHLTKIWADEAEASKNAAALSAESAEASATASATSAAEALTSKVAAARSEATATTKATEAATSAATASTKATAASTSASAAVNSAEQAASDALRAETAANNAEVIAGGLFVPLTRAVNAGTGLSGGGDLTADRTLAVTFGTTAGTVCQGNDSRLTNARTPTAHAAIHKNGGTDEIATATPAANAIPKAGVDGKLDAGWLPEVSFVRVLSYADRGQLRLVSDAKQGDVAVVRELGLFDFIPDSPEPDDDETAFAATGGVWLLQAASLDLALSSLRKNFAAQSWFDVVEVAPTVTSIAAGQSVTIQVDGVSGIEGGEKMMVIPPAGANILLTSRAYSNYYRRLFLVLGNPTASALDVDASELWRVAVLFTEADYGS